MKNTYILAKRSKEGYLRAHLKQVFVTLLILILAAAPGITAYGAEVTPATATEVNVIIDYLEETAKVTAGSGGSKRFYVSKDKKTWELITGDTLDISTFLKTKETIIYFKGNKDITVREVKLAGEDSSLKGAYTVIGGVGRIELSGSTLPVEYRKGAHGSWKTYIPPFFTAPYEAYGATIYFRTTGAATRRPGKIVSVKVPKRSSAPSVKVDGSKLYISGVKPGETLYRTALKDEWTLIPSDSQKTIDLKYFLAPTATPNEPLPSGTIEFMTTYNDAKKKVASAVKVIEVPAQPVKPTNITLTGTTLTVTDTNKRKYYEYTRITGPGTLDIKTAKWTSFTSAKPVIVKGAAVGDRIFVRAKSYTDTDTKQVVPASVYLELPAVTSISITRK